MKTFIQYIQKQKFTFNEVADEIRQKINGFELHPKLEKLSKIAYFTHGKNYTSTVAMMDSMIKYDHKEVPVMDAHGLAKLGTVGNLKSLVMLLRKGTLDKMHTAPLFSSEDSAGIGAGLGTSGTAYRDGDFIVVSAPGQSLHKEGIRYILVAESYADIDPKLLGGENPIEILQDTLGEGGKYKFIAVGETNNTLDSFIKEVSQQNKNQGQQSVQKPMSDEQILKSVKQILNNMKVDEKDAEIKKFPPPKIIGVRNKKEGTAGFGTMVYLDTQKPDYYNKFKNDLKKSFN